MVRCRGVQAVGCGLPNGIRSPTKCQTAGSDWGCQRTLADLSVTRIRGEVLCGSGGFCAYTTKTGVCAPDRRIEHFPAETNTFNATRQWRYRDHDQSLALVPFSIKVGPWLLWGFFFHHQHG